MRRGGGAVLAAVTAVQRGQKNKPTSLDLRSSFVATRQSANKFAFALAAPKLAWRQEKPYIALSGEGRLRLGIVQASLALHSACTALDAHGRVF